MSNNIIITRTCPNCHTEIKVATLPSGILVDPCPPPQLLPITTAKCPNCGRKVLVWTGFRQVVKE